MPWAATRGSWQKRLHVYAPIDAVWAGALSGQSRWKQQLLHGSNCSQGRDLSSDVSPSSSWSSIQLNLKWTDFGTNWIPHLLPISSLCLETSATALCGRYANYNVRRTNSFLFLGCHASSNHPGPFEDLSSFKTGRRSWMCPGEGQRNFVQQTRAMELRLGTPGSWLADKKLPRLVGLRGPFETWLLTWNRTAILAAASPTLSMELAPSTPRNRFGFNQTSKPLIANETWWSLRKHRKTLLPTSRTSSPTPRLRAVQAEWAYIGTRTEEFNKAISKLKNSGSQAGSGLWVDSSYSSQASTMSLPENQAGWCTRPNVSWIICHWACRAKELVGPVDVPQATTQGSLKHCEFGSCAVWTVWLTRLHEEVNVLAPVVGAIQCRRLRKTSEILICQKCGQMLTFLHFDILWRWIWPRSRADNILCLCVHPAIHLRRVTVKLSGEFGIQGLMMRFSLITEILGATSPSPQTVDMYLHLPNMSKLLLSLRFLLFQAGGELFGLGAKISLYCF